MAYHFVIKRNKTRKIEVVVMAKKSMIAPSPFGKRIFRDAQAGEEIVVEQGAYLDGLEVLTCFKNDTQVKPLLIFYHGYTQNKFSNMQIVFELAREGFYVVAPEVGGHGGRRSEQLPMWALLEATVAEVERLIRACKALPLVDESRVGLGGVSFGAVVTYHYLIWGKERVQAAAVLSGTPDLVGLLGQPLGFLTPDQGAGLAMFKPPSLAEKNKALAKAENYSALNHWQRLQEVPLLMLHGDQDEAVSLVGEAKLYELMKAEGLGPDLDYRVYEGVPHEGNNSMKRDLVSWFKENLLLKHAKGGEKNGQ